MLVLPIPMVCGLSGLAACAAPGFARPAVAGLLVHPGSGPAEGEDDDCDEGRDGGDDQPVLNGGRTDLITLPTPNSRHGLSLPRSVTTPGTPSDVPGVSPCY